jgi:hypothetical protein
MQKRVFVCIQNRELVCILKRGLVYIQMFWLVS